MEIELKIAADENIVKAILDKKYNMINESKQYDIYYRHFDDLQKKIVIRLRDSNGKKYLTYKGEVNDEKIGDTSWHEWEEEINDFYGLKSFFDANSFVKVVEIEKERRSFQVGDIILNIDNIFGLGSFIELEVIRDDHETGRLILETFLAEELLISKSMEIKKGYVTLMLENEN